MLNTKLFATILLALAVMFAQVGNVAAATQKQDTTPITGTIQSIATETDASGVTTVIVTLLDDQGAIQTVRVSLDTAVTLGLVTLDPATNEPVVDETQIGQTVEIDPTTVIPDEGMTEEAVHPIAALLANFFNEDPSVVNGYHEDGFGFGVIAQAMWMSESLNGDATAADLILEAKRSGDYSAFELPDGSSPTNWGQFKKAIMQKDKKNLGIIVSGHADDSSEDSATQEDHGNGKNKEKKQKKHNNNRP
jgi:hypothetical protein